MKLGKRRGAPGQASVEVALVLPVLLGAALVLAEVGLVAKDYVLVVHAAREAARAAAVDPSSKGAAARAVAGTTGLARDRLHVTTRRRGPLVVVRVSYRRVTNVRFFGRKLPDFPLDVQVSAYVEG